MNNANTVETDFKIGVIQLLREICFLISVLYATYEVAYLSSAASQTIASAILFSICLSIIVFEKCGMSSSRIFFVFILLLGTLVAAPYLPRETTLLVPTFWLIVFRHFGDAGFWIWKRCMPAVLLFAIVRFGTLSIPEIGYAWRQAAYLLSSVIGTFTTHFEFGPSILGLGAFVLVLGYGVSFAIEYSGKSRKKILLVPVIVTASFLLFHFSCSLCSPWIYDTFGDYLSFPVLAEILHRKQVLMPFSIFVRLVGIGVFVLISCLMISIVRWNNSDVLTGKEATAERGKSKSQYRTIFSIVIVVVAVAAGILFVPGKQNDRSVVISTNGRYSMDRPTPDQYGGRAAGMLGNILQIVSRLGYEVAHEEFDSKSLEGKSIAISINRRAPFETNEIESIHKFVKQGGCLLVLADHTRFEEDDPLNELLEPVGIRLLFDTVQPFEMGWGHGIELNPGLLPIRPNSSHKLMHWVGASLQIKPNVRPLLIGKHAFADYGVEENLEMNKLGDRNANPGEQVGDHILAAVGSLGRGKVIVYGDTTSFQNLQATKSWEYISGVLSLACRESEKRIPSWVAAMLFLLGCSVYGWAQINKENFAFAWPVFCLVGIVFLGNWQTDSSHKATLPEFNVSKVPLAVVDLSHGERLVLDNQLDSAVDGLLLNCMRNNYLPIIEYDDLFRHLGSADTVFLVAPSIPFSNSEVEKLIRYVNLGGSLFLSVGHNEKAASQPLLDKLEIQIGTLPLGGLNPVNTPNFHEAWPLILDENNDNFKVLARMGEHVLCAEKKIGSGRVVVIGDSMFFQAKNIETAGRSGEGDTHIFEVRKSNVEFLRTLLDK